MLRIEAYTSYVGIQQACWAYSARRRRIVMGSTLVDRYPTPEAAIAALKHQRTTKLMLVMGGLVVALTVLFGASYLMFSEEPDAARIVAPK
jgi:hypothetical protein